VPARREEAGDDPVAGLETLDLTPNVLDDAHELVAEHRTLVDRGVAVEDVKVGAADGAESDLDEGLARTVDAGLGHVGDLDLALALKGQRPHGQILRAS